LNAVGCRHLERFGRDVLHDVGENLEVRRAARDVDVLGERMRLARVGDFRV